LFVLSALISLPDPSARGLDVFVLAPPSAPAGGVLPIELVAYGFVEVVRVVPLPGAELEAVWHPDSVGEDLSPVRAIADSSGHAALKLPVPEGEPKKLTLLISIRHNGRSRTRELEISRARDREIRLYVPDTRVVPGSVITAWALARAPSSLAPLKDSPVELSLLEGGVTRWRARVTTDASGRVSARVPIPATKEPAWSWELRASLVSSAGREAETSLALSPREETPAEPSLRIHLEDDRLLAGESTSFRITVLDAASRAVAAAPIRFWVGSKSAEPKDEKSFEARSEKRTTDPSGVLVETARAPTTVPPSGGELTIVAKAEIEGHTKEARASILIAPKTPEIELIPEGGAIVPGVAQRLLLRVLDGAGDGVTGRFVLRGDGLFARVTTDAHGEAELTWRAPDQIGASHPSGPCASSIAATVVIDLEEVQKPIFKARYQRCVRVARDSQDLLVLDRPIARAGEKVKLRVQGGRGRKFELIALGEEGIAPFGGQLSDGERGGEIEIPENARGILQITALSPGEPEKTRATAASLLVVPQILPKLTATITAGRFAPKGWVEIEARVTDEHGAGLPGTVSAAVIDLFGGGHSGGLLDLDTRRELHSSLGLGAIDEDRIDRLLEGDRALDPVGRTALAGLIAAPIEPLSDPAKNARRDFEESFATVVRSLEGAVFESTESLDRLLDARREGPRGFELNPELLTLVTSAMESPPLTPGGEEVVLADLRALDRQVDFDHVARRITRLKIFRVLEIVRRFVYDQRLLPDEVAMRDPGAILRRLVRDGEITDSMLLDPWGRTLTFVRANDPPLPFLSPIPGYRLRSPGPDGRLMTSDDVDDPFGRALASGTPYARAVEEDRLVDARYEAVVGDATVEMWSELFSRLTGTALGDEGTIGLGSMGSHGYGGGGGGLGSASGSAVARVSRGIATSASLWIPPVRTDDRGVAKLRVPLPEAETTWRITLIGAPDRAGTAAGFVDVPVALPLSVRIESGASWIEGDEVDLEISLRNREKQSEKVRLSISPSGVLEIAPADRTKEAEVPAGGVASIGVRARALRAGEARIELEAIGARSRDRLSHTFEVKRASKEIERWTARWLSGDDEIHLEHEDLVPFGHAQLEITRGQEGLLSSALESFEPDRLHNLRAETFAIEAAARIARSSPLRFSEDSPLRTLAKDRANRALARAQAYSLVGRTKSWIDEQRIARWAPPDPSRRRADCPPSLQDRTDRIAALELEPDAERGAIRACWDALATEVSASLSAGASALDLARAHLALFERAHRRDLAASIGAKLKEKVRRSSIVLENEEASSRSARAIVHAALLLSSRGDRDLVAGLLEQQSPQGDFGSAEATRDAIIALLSLEDSASRPIEVTVEAPGRPAIPIELAERSSTRFTLDPGTRSARVHMQEGGALVRLSQVVLRSWSKPPIERGDLLVEAHWPEETRAKDRAVLRLSLQSRAPGTKSVEIRLPLPPGVSLAERVQGARQVQGELVFRTDLSPSAVSTLLELPIRAALAGTLTIPEGEAHFLDDETDPLVIPARRWEVLRSSPLTR
jgi:hypothetical protein